MSTNEFMNAFMRAYGLGRQEHVEEEPLLPTEQEPYTGKFPLTHGTTIDGGERGLESESSMWDEPNMNEWLRRSAEPYRRAWR